MKRLSPPSGITSIVWLGFAIVFATWQPVSVLRVLAAIVFLGLAIWGGVMAVRRRSAGRRRD